MTSYNERIFSGYLKNMKLEECQEKNLASYAAMLSKANARARLTGPSDEAVILGEHIKDAVRALPWLEKFPAGSDFVDVGTGGGLPGIVWGICRPDLNGLLIDSVGKKIDIVREMAVSLDLRNITAMKARSEELAAERREQFDIATARAVAGAKVLAEYLSPLVKTGGRIIIFKGPACKAEIDIPPGDWQKLGLGAPRLAPYSVAGKELYFVIWEKISPCPARFPRKPGEAKTRPWH
jgi:16S rRNA (guanine527-N7)-methyltransferase